MTARRTPFAFLFFAAAFAALLFAGHLGFLRMPFFWDELGQYVPGALDLLHDGSLIPHSAIPNVHPPAVMAWLAIIWSVTGYSIEASRSAMLILAALGALLCFLLSIELSRGTRTAPAFIAVLFLLVDPLFFTQSMMVQLDMPAMVFSLAGLLLFLQDRHRSAAIACIALVMSKETGIVLPLILGFVLAIRRDRTALLYALPVLALGAWIAYLWTVTGHPFGDPAFAKYNTAYSLHPVRAITALLRRAYYLFLVDGRWIGSIAISLAFRKGFYSTPAWRTTALFALATTVEVSLLGGAQLERYLMPVLPVFYIAAAAAFTQLPSRPRRLAGVAMALALIAGSLINPPYPYPFENNLAVDDFVGLHQTAAAFLEQRYPRETVHTAWPLTAELRTPEFGYVRRRIETVETSDFRYSAISRLDPKKIAVLVLYSRTDDTSAILKIGPLRRFLARYFEYEPQITRAQCREILGLRPVIRFSRRGQWIEVFENSSRYHKEAEGSSQ